jgi:hypothetical protein
MAIRYPQFDLGLALRSTGNSLDMYDDDENKARQMWIDDARASWAKDPKAFRAQMLSQKAKEQAMARSGNRPQQQSQSVSRAQAGGEEQPSMFSPQFQHAHASGMAGRAMAAWDREHQSRVSQSREAKQRQHELSLASMEHQRTAQAQQSQVNAQAAAEDRKRERNAALLSAAGVGGHSIRTDGRGGVSVSPIGRSLLG